MSKYKVGSNLFCWKLGGGGVKAEYKNFLHSFNKLISEICKMHVRSLYHSNFKSGLIFM